MKGAAALKQERIYTLKDIDALPEQVRAELFDGQIYYMTSPTRKHQDIAGALFWFIRSHIVNNKCNCKAYIAPFAVFLNNDDKNYVEPDISVICDRNKLSDKGCHGAPDWIIEVVSPGSHRMDYVKKLFKYRSSGVKEYWIVDSEKETITVWEFNGEENDDMHEYTFTDKVPCSILDDLIIDFTQLDLS